MPRRSSNDAPSSTASRNSTVKTASLVVTANQHITRFQRRREPQRRLPRLRRRRPNEDSDFCRRGTSPGSRDLPARRAEPRARDRRQRLRSSRRPATSPSAHDVLDRRLERSATRSRRGANTIVRSTRSSTTSCRTPCSVANTSDGDDSTIDGKRGDLLHPGDLGLRHDHQQLRRADAVLGATTRTAGCLDQHAQHAPRRRRPRRSSTSPSTTARKRLRRRHVWQFDVKHCLPGDGRPDPEHPRRRRERPWPRLRTVRSTGASRTRSARRRSGTTAAASSRYAPSNAVITSNQLSSTPTSARSASPASPSNSHRPRAVGLHRRPPLRRLRASTRSSSTPRRASTSSST